MSWAASAAWEDDYRHLQRVLEHVGALPRVESAWKTLPARDQYLAGEKHPSLGTVEELAATLPGTRDVYHSLVWRALNPRTDLEGCADISIAIERDLRLTDALERLHGADPSAIAPHIADAKVVALLLAAIRRHEQHEDHCFDVAQALLRAILGLALASGRREMAELLWNLAATYVLANLKKNQVTLRARPEHFTRLLVALDERLSAVKRATGRLGVGYHMNAYPYVVKLSLFWPFVYALTTPGSVAAECLEELLSSYEPRSKACEWFNEHSMFVEQVPRRPATA
jgi:hypothetical protein